MANQVVYPKLRTTRQLRKRVQVTIGSNGGTGFQTVPDGAEEVYYEVSLDLADLQHMARKAAANKGWKAKDGPLHLRVLATKRIEEN